MHHFAINVTFGHGPVPVIRKDVADAYARIHELKRGLGAARWAWFWMVSGQAGRFYNGARSSRCQGGRRLKAC